MRSVMVQDVAVPKLGHGTWMLEGDTCVQAVQHALAVGYRHIDTAQIYGNEAEVGQALAAADAPRGEVFLTTKIWRENVAAERLEASLDESLRKLRTDYVDLLLIHWPVEDVPLAEQMEALQAVQRKGKTRLIGVSNFTLAQMRYCVEELGVKLATNQVEYHPYLSQQRMLDYLRVQGMFLTAYSPMGRAKLVGDDTLQAIAEHHGVAVGQVILRWHLQQPEVVAIPKSGTKAHIAANIDIFRFELSEDEMLAITELTSHHRRLINPEFAPKWDAPEPA